MKSAAARPPSSTLQTLIDLTWKLNAPATQIPFDVNVAGQGGGGKPPMVAHTGYQLHFTCL